MLLTTSNHFENYIIEDYCGIVSGECVLGTGFLSSIDASIADFLGISSTAYNEKLDSAKKTAISIVEKKASALGANAIIAIDVDYTSFSADLMGVVVNGTAVRIAPAGSRKDFLLSSQDNCLLKPLRLILKSNTDSVLSKVEISAPFSASSLSCILSNIQLTTFFGDSFLLQDIAFSDFCKSDSRFMSCYCPLPISSSQLLQIQSVSISITKYSLDNSSVVSSPTFSDISLASNSISSQTLFSRAEHLHSAREILNLLQEWKEAHSNDIPLELETQIENLAKAERLYGNMKDSCIQKLKEYGF